MSIRIVVLDVDWTLTSEVDGKLVESNALACKLLQQKGIKVAVGTGRPPYAIPQIEGKIFPDYYLCSNGHLITDNQYNVIDASYFSTDLRNRMVDYCKGKEIGLVFKYIDGVYCYQNCPAMESISSNLSKFYFYPNPDENQLPNSSFIVADRELIKDFAKEFEDELDVVDGGYQLFDINLKGVNKGTGLKLMLEHLGIDRSECMAFGDSDNDIEMVQYAGVGVAMGNGYETLKKHADYITDKASEDGIIKALKKFDIL